MELVTVSSDGAPKAIGPYSQAIRCGRYIHLSGQIGMDPANGEMVPGGLTGQMARVLENIRAILEAGNSSLSQVVKTTIYLRDMSDFAEVNRMYGEAFREPYPARATVAVAGLPLDALVEMELIALCE